LFKLPEKFGIQIITESPVVPSIIPCDYKELGAISEVLKYARRTSAMFLPECGP